ncbi:hypothetical protein M3671_18995, partial [Bacillus safensis]
VLAGDGGEAALVDYLNEKSEVGQEVQIHLCSRSKSALAGGGIIAVGINNILAGQRGESL